ncbi:MAG: CYTH domain-containing protein [Acetobacteraceae bacterium]|nr:CYTH domain-containing protein [Acetobacteraceae bacterium]
MPSSWGGGAAGVECELKLLVAGGGEGAALEVFERLRRAETLGPFSLGPLEEEEVRDVYWDTVGGELGAAGLALRLRRAGSGPRITLKARGACAGGYATRPEWEADLTPGSLARCLTLIAASGVPDPGACRLEEFLAGERCGRLRPVLEVVAQRCRRRLSLGGQEVGLLSLDRTAYPGREGGPLYGIEIEAAGQGTVAHLRQAEAHLVALAPGLLEPDPLTKLDRGLGRTRL